MEEIFYSNAELHLKEECDLPYLYHYVQSRFNIKKRGFSLNSSDSKVYYKLRHNVFKMIVSFLCSIPVSEEKSFSYYGLVDSNRTPDYIFYDMYEKKVEMLEFSVSNTKKATIQNKESFGKYNLECDLMREKGINVLDKYFCMSLDADVQELVENIEEYLYITKREGPEDLHTTLTQLKDEFLYLNWHLNETMPELLSNVDYAPEVITNLPSINLPNLFEVRRKVAGVSRVKNVFLKKRVMLHSRTLLKSFRRKSKTFKFKLNYNFKDDVLYSSLDEHGLDKDEIMNLLMTEDDKILEIVNVIGSYESVDDPFIKYGDVSMDIESLNERNKIIDEDFVDNYTEQISYRLSRLKTQTLSDCLLTDSVHQVKPLYDNNLKKLREQSENVVIEKKNPFIFVPVDGILTGNYEPFASSKFKITDRLLKTKVSTHLDKQITRDVDYELLTKIEKDTSILWSKIKKIPNIKTILRSKDLSLSLSEEEIHNINCYKEQKSKFSSAVSEAKRTTYKNRVSIPLSEYKRLFPLEMEHFNKRSNLHYIFPDTDLNYVKNQYLTLAEELFSKTTNKTSDCVFSDTEPIGVKLKLTCEQMQEELQSAESEFLHTVLSSNTLLISQLCYSLMYYSNIKLNKNDFCLDNLGYSNVLLIVRGGQKILKTRRSRLFKLLIPISKNTKDIISTGSLEFCKKGNQRYVIMPWRQLNQSILKKGLELHNSFGCYYISNKLESGLDPIHWNNFTTLKIFNFFSQKRKMEVWFSNLRYIYFNSTGTHTDVLSLINSMVEYDYDSYFYLIQRLFSRGYLRLTQTVSEGKIYDILYDQSYDNFDLCYEKFEETAFMAKAPVDQVNEHLGNLIKILKIHKEFKSHYKSDDPYDILEKSKVDLSSEDLDSELYKNDFTFDPKLCLLIGRHVADVASTSVTKSDLETSFSKILSESVTNIATSKGMRNSEGSFWGDKGFDVVFNKLKLRQKVYDTVNKFPIKRSELDNLVKSTEKTYKDAIEENENLRLEFDAKDKLQYKGSREIYVMSDTTKTLQQPIENFMKVLCRLLPNELMHKKSHVRPKLIHRKVFENRDVIGKTMYCTLDCTKWAPKSNIWKYAFFIEGMSSILPQSFITYFKQVWSLMFKKVIRIQRRYKEMLDTNLKNESLVKFLKERDDGDYELLMPYSFMMGIFNYLSSLFHAGSQLFFNKHVSSPKGVFFNLMAHSDDSGGSIVANKYEDCVKMFKYYEHFQKCCNHLMSKKKSSLSPNSFELISIMYNNSRLIPMTHKFMTNVSIDPTGESWYNDICTVVGKIVDAFNNGASILQCYAVMLAQGELLRKAYHLPRSKNLSSVPLHFGGLFNMHPLHLILLGSCAQEVMLDLIESERMRDFRVNTYKLFTGDYIIGRGSNLKTRLPYFVSHPNMLPFDDTKNEILTNLSLLTERSTFLDAIRYYNGIKGAKFKYALLNVDSYKLLYSTLFYKLSVVDNAEEKGCTLVKLCQNYMGFSILGVKPERNYLNYSNEINYLKASETIFIDYKNISVLSKKSCKPMIYNTFMNIGLNLSFEDVSSIKLFNAGDEYKELLKNKKKWKALTDWVLANLGGDDDTEKLKQLSLIERKDLEKMRSCYMFIPSGVNIDTIERFWTYSMLYCSRRNYISSDMPQFFTMEKFEFWQLPFDSLKHHYLLIKMAFDDDNLRKNSSKYLNSIYDCTECETKDTFKGVFEEILKIKELGPWTRFNTFLPFVTYTRPQYRGQNVWYGSTDFKINTTFGSVTHHVVDGNIKTIWNIYQDAYMDQLWHVYKLFCDSRGVDIPDLIYDNTGIQLRRLAFNSLNNPFIPNANDYQLILENSSVINSDYVRPELQTDWNGRPMFEEELVDFCIYHVYDINQDFFQRHKLSEIQDLILPVSRTISKSVLMNNFLESKLYSILNLDQTHKSQQPLLKKYANKELLGSLGSFTRALCLADELGKIKYRSSVSVDKIYKNTILESQTIQDIPLIDLYNSSSMSRVTYQQQKVLMKLANEDELDARDYEILNTLAEKLGLVTSATMLTNYKSIFNKLDPSQFSKIPSTEKLKCIIQIIEAVHSCIDDFPQKKRTYQWEKSKTEFWKTFVALTKNAKKSHQKYLEKLQKTKRKLRQPKSDYLAILITKGIFRGDSDNSNRFWNIRKENILSAIIPISFLNAQNLFFIVKVILSQVINDHFEEFFTYIENKKMYVKCKKSKFDEVENEEFEDHEIMEELKEDVTDIDFPKMVIDIDDEDQTDCFTGRDIPEDYSKRLWNKGDDEEIVINTPEDFIKAESYTVTKNFKTLKIYHIVEFVNFSWLGPSNKELETIDNLTYYCTSYPGKSGNIQRLDDEKLLVKQKSKEFEDAYKNYTNKLKDSAAAEAANKKIKETSEILGDDFKDYYNEAFQKSHLLKTSIIEKWINVDTYDLKTILTNLLKNFKLDVRTKKRKTKNYLPGFSGVLDDPILVSELRSLFGENYFFLTSGQMVINKKSHKMLIQSIRSIYKKVNNHHKGFLIFLMSVLRESILTDGESDVKLTDIIMGYISDMQDLYDDDSIDLQNTIAPDPMENHHLKHEYKTEFLIPWANMPDLEIIDNVVTINNNIEQIETQTASGSAERLEPSIVSPRQSDSEEHKEREIYESDDDY